MLYRLHEAGFGAFLVGGCVRDLLLGRKPKDFDIATNARPEEIRRLFKNCRLIGKRFRLAHIIFGRDIIEVATFRTHHQNAAEQHARMHQGMIVRDNVYGSIEDDAIRRDFSINALYYNIADFSVMDYTGGMADIETRLLRMIGDADKRYHEDPVRLLRAARFIGKLKLEIEPTTEEPIQRLSHLLEHVSPARLFQEVLKLFEEGALLDTFNVLQKYRLFEQLFAQTADCIQHDPISHKLITLSLENTDTRIREDKPISSAFLFSVLLWPSIQKEAAHEEHSGLPLYIAYEKAIHAVIKKQTQQLAITRHLQVAIRDICFLQHRFTQRQGHRPYRVLEHPRYKAAYDLLILRHEAGENVKELLEWWTRFFEGDSTTREEMLKAMGKSRLHKKRRKPRNFTKKMML